MNKTDGLFLVLCRHLMSLERFFNPVHDQVRFRVTLANESTQCQKVREKRCIWLLSNYQKRVNCKCED